MENTVPTSIIWLKQKGKDTLVFLSLKRNSDKTLFLKTCHLKDTAALDCPSHSTCGLQRKLVYKKKAYKIIPKIHFRMS